MLGSKLRVIMPRNCCYSYLEYMYIGSIDLRSLSGIELAILGLACLLAFRSNLSGWLGMMDSGLLGPGSLEAGELI